MFPRLVDAVVTPQCLVVRSLGAGRLADEREVAVLPLLLLLVQLVQLLLVQLLLLKLLLVLLLLLLLKVGVWM